MNWKKSKLFFQKIVRIIFCLIIFLNHTEINIYFARLVLHGRWIACRIINTDTITVEDVSFPTCTFLYTDCSTHGSHIIAGGFAWTATLVVFHVFWALRFIWLTKTVLGKNHFLGQNPTGFPSTNLIFFIEIRLKFKFLPYYHHHHYHSLVHKQLPKRSKNQKFSFLSIRILWNWNNDVSKVKFSLFIIVVAI